MRIVIILLIVISLYPQNYLSRKDTVETITDNHTFFINRNDSILQTKFDYLKSYLTLSGFGHITGYEDAINDSLRQSLVVFPQATKTHGRQYLGNDHYIYSYAANMLKIFSPNVSIDQNVLSYGNGATLTNGLANRFTLKEDTVAVDGFLKCYSNFYTDKEITNTHLGYNSGNATTTAINNTLIGYLSGQNLTGGYYNTIIGSNAGSMVTGGLTNTAIGEEALASYIAMGVQQPTGNACMGYKAGYQLRTGGDYNVILGYSAGTTMTTSDHCIIIGNAVNPTSGTTDYEINIGNVYRGTRLDSTAIVDKLRSLSVQNDLYLDYKTTDTTLYVVSKYNNSYDLVSVWKNTMANDLFSFERIGLKANTADTLCYTGLGTHTIQLSYNRADDAIGPVYVSYPSLRSGWAGANHTTAGLKKTAKNMSYKIIVNGQEIRRGFKGYAKHANIRVHNEIYNPVIIDATGTKNKIIDEYVTYNLSRNTIEVSVQHMSDSTFTLYNYYGMQYPYYAGETWKDSVYIAHSDSAYFCSRNITLKSGALTSYPDVEKVIYSNTTKSITTTMWMDNSYGMPKTPATYITDLTLNKFIHYGEQNKKGYYRLADRYNTTGHNSWGWRGSYSFEDMSANSGNGYIASGLMYRNEKPLMFIDTKDTCDVVIPVEMANKKVNASLKDNTISQINNLNSYKQTVNASSYGNIYLEEMPFNEDFSVGGDLIIGGYTSSVNKHGVYAQLVVPDTTFITTANTFQPITGAFNNRILHGFTFDSDHITCHTPDSTYFIIDLRGSFTVANNTRTVSLGTSINGETLTVANYDGVLSSFAKIANEQYFISTSRVVKLIEGDQIQIQTASSADGAEIRWVGFIATIQRFNLF